MDERIDKNALRALEQAIGQSPSARVRRELSALGNAKLASMSATDLRDLAIRADLSPAAHSLLDQVGVPFVSTDEASRLGAHAIDGLKVNAFREIHREHPQELREWLSVGRAVANMKLAYGLVTGKPRKKRAIMFALATQFGADWSIYRADIAKNYPKALVAYDDAVARASATALQAQAPSAPKVPRVRF